MSYPVQRRHIYRNTTHRWVGGVFQGVADTYGWDANLLRIIFIASSFFIPGPQWISYALAWFLIPPRY
ncbi:MAG: PspC domain-containing protein [Corynebacterium sp.]|nr:PspC domain-containing protein [Corynebacterium sp.]